MRSAHVHVVLGEEPPSAALEAALRRAGASARFDPLSDVLRRPTLPSADAMVVVAPRPGSSDSQRMSTLWRRVADRPRATLLVAPVGAAEPRGDCPGELPVSISVAPSEDELAARLRTLIDLGPSLARLARKPAPAPCETGKTPDLTRELTHAGRIQRSLFPRQLPPIDPFSLHAIYRPASDVAGDIFDVRRLEDDHVALALADAEGKGVPAALLTVLAKRALEFGARLDTVPPRPQDVLRRLNQDLCAADLADCGFVAAVYAVLHLPSRRLRLARSGAPYPLIRRADGSMELIRSEGIVAGVCADAEFECIETTLNPGDALLLYSDGVDTIAPPSCPGGDSTRLARTLVTASRHVTPAPGRRFRHRSPSAAVLRNRVAGYGSAGAAPGQALESAAPAAAGSFTNEARRLEARGELDRRIRKSPWYRRFQCFGAEALVGYLSARHDIVRRLGLPLDDVTALALHSGPQ